MDIWTEILGILLKMLEFIESQATRAINSLDAVFLFISENKAAFKRALMSFGIVGAVASQILDAVLKIAKFFAQQDQDEREGVFARELFQQLGQFGGPAFVAPQFGQPGV